MEQQHSLMKGSAISLSVYALFLAALLVFLGQRATIKVTEVSQDRISGTETQIEEIQISEMKELLVVQKGAQKDSIEIPLDGTVSSTDIMAQNNYLDKQIKVVIPHADESFYRKDAIVGDPSQLQNATYQYIGEDINIFLSMDDVYDINTKYERDCLTIILEKPYRVYDKIVLIDPAGKEDDVAWKIACNVRDVLEEANIKVYFTRTEQTASETGRTLSLEESLKPDMAVCIVPGEDSDPEIFGTKVYYNDLYFTPGLPSADFADLMEREVTTGISGYALGIEAENTGFEVLAGTTVPTVLLVPGYYSCEKEKILLDQDQYQKKIADGVCAAVMKAYERLEQDE